MIDYIGVRRVRELVERVGTARLLGELAQEIEADFARWAEFEKVPRVATHVLNGVIELMPTTDGRYYAFKYVNGHPKNTARDLLTVAAFGMLAEADSGYPVLLSEMTFATALRTAATSALASRWLARPGSQVMAVIGNGAQSEFQVLAFHELLGIREVHLFDTDAAATSKLVANIRSLGLQGLTVKRCKSVGEAVVGADIVTTVTADKCYATILTPGMIAPGMHLNAVGGDCPGKTELHRDILLRPDARVFVEYEPQTRIEGEIQQVAADFAVTEFGCVVAGKAKGRSSPLDVTIFDSVGFALEDFSVLRYLWRLNRDVGGAREQIDLLPDPEDPKDLFGNLRGRRSRSKLAAVR
jgi:ornithine cyclodeaminase